MLGWFPEWRAGLGYSINKVVEMLHSEHIRGLSKEMKRAAVLMALDSAGIAISEVLGDAQARPPRGTDDAGQRRAATGSAASSARPASPNLCAAWYGGRWPRIRNNARPLMICSLC